MKAKVSLDDVPLDFAARPRPAQPTQPKWTKQVKWIASKIAGWWEYRVVCGWCVPQRHLRGNPWAKKTSHGICRACMEKAKASIGAGALRDRQWMCAVRRRGFGN